MALGRRIWNGLLLTGLAVTGGGGVQDPDQPPVGSISAPASRDDDSPRLAPGKMKTAPAARK